jgi:AcrR family transcriptional regulator
MASSLRERLLDAAFEALVEEGPRFRVEEVAARAEASKALVFHHFGSREGLLDAMAARVLAQTQEGLERLGQDHPNPRDRLDALARTLLEEPLGDAGAAEARRVLLFWLQDDADGGCRGALRDALLADFVEQTLREATRFGLVRAGVDPARVASVLLARWHGATVLHASGEAVDFGREADALVAELGRLLGA